PRRREPTPKPSCSRCLLQPDRMCSTERRGRVSPAHASFSSGGSTPFGWGTRLGAPLDPPEALLTCVGRSLHRRVASLVPWRQQAEVAELADAPDSKSGSLRGVWVRFPPSALAP